MKNTQIIFIIWFLFFSCKKENKNSNQFIEFEYAGLITKIHYVLYVSTEKIVIKMNEEQLTELTRILGNSANLTEQEKDAYIDTRYHRIISDSLTIATIREFIFHNQKFFVNTQRQNSPINRSYNIIINGPKKFSIYQKSQRQFFNELLTYLTQKKCDKNVIREISCL